MVDFEHYILLVKERFPYAIDEDRFWYEVRKEGEQLMLKLLDDHKPVTEGVALINYADLRKADLSLFKQSVILITTECCAECLELDEKVIPLEEALETLPLPFKGCTRERGCNCCYGFKGLRDKKGRLIFKNAWY
jgi:hypothetical protein